MLLYNLQMHQRYLKNATKCYNKLWHHPILLVINSVWIFSCFIYRSIYRNVGNCTSFSSRGVTTSLKTSNAERSPPPLWLWGNSWSTITLTIPQDECSSKLFWAVRTHPGSVRVEMQNGYTVKQLIFFLCSNPLRGNQAHCELEASRPWSLIITHQGFHLCTYLEQQKHLYQLDIGHFGKRCHHHKKTRKQTILLPSHAGKSIFGWDSSSSWLLALSGLCYCVSHWERFLEPYQTTTSVPS